MKRSTYKICKGCHQSKLVTNFYKKKNSRDKLNAKCIPCVKEYQKNRRNRLQHTEEFQRKQKDASLRFSYGIGIEEYEEMFTRQGGVCYICRDDKPLEVDHCHRSGDVRGLLCHRCNWTLGLIDDDVDWLNSAINYLQKESVVA